MRAFWDTTPPRELRGSGEGEKKWRHLKINQGCVLKKQEMAATSFTLTAPRRMYSDLARCLTDDHLRGWEVMSYIGSGVFGDVFDVCRDGRCVLAVKLIPFRGESGPQLFAEEVSNLRDAYRYDVGPEVFGSWICEGVQVSILRRSPIPTDVGFILVERWEGDLRGVPLEAIPEECKENLVRSLIQLYHRTGMVNTDLKSDNILYRTDSGGRISKLVVGDWGNVLRNPSEQEYSHPESRIDEDFRYGLRMGRTY